MEFVSEIGKGRIGLPLEGRRHDATHPGLAGPARGKARVRAVAGDQEEGVGCRHGGSHDPIPSGALGVA